MRLALFPRALARVMYSDLVMVDLGRPKNSLIMSKGSATSPAPQKTMNSSHPAAMTGPQFKSGLLNIYTRKHDKPMMQAMSCTHGTCIHKTT